MPTRRASDLADDLDVDRYLERIGVTSPVSVDHRSLAALQLAHMVAVPFENLHVHAGVPVRTALDWSVPKIVTHRRGGWCFELNGAFSALLRAIGFTVTLHSAQVFSAASGELGPPLDHLCLVVHDVGGARRLVDVGFGDSSVQPLLLDTTAEQPSVPRPCRVAERDGAVHLEELMPSRGWELQYVIDPAPRSLGEFQPRSDELASGAGGPHWTDKPFATRALDGGGGRIWLSRDRLKQRAAGSDATTEEPVDPAHWDATLLDRFGLTRPSA